MESSDFESRVRAAAGAAWSVFLVGMAMLIFGWLAYLAISAGHLDCLLWARRLRSRT